MKEVGEEEKIYKHISVTLIIQVRSDSLSTLFGGAPVVRFSSSPREGVQIDCGPHKNKKKESHRTHLHFAHAFGYIYHPNISNAHQTLTLEKI
jgi:hypothetical protein